MIDEPYVPNDADYIYACSDDGTYVLELRQNSTLIATRTLAANADLTTYLFTLTAGERATITDWSNLYVWFTVNGTNTAKLKLTLLYPPISGEIGRAHV